MDYNDTNKSKLLTTTRGKAIIAYFTVTVEAGVDLVFIQPLLLYYVDRVVLINKINKLVYCYLLQ